MASILLYISPLILSLAGLDRKLASSALPNIISCTLIFLVLGLRDGVGFDYKIYMQSLEAGIQFREPLSQMLAAGAMLLGKEHLFFVFNALVLASTLLYVSRYKTGSIWLIVNFIALPWFFIESFSTVRQATSIALAVAAYASFADRRFSRFLIFSLLSIGFHFGAIPFVFVLVWLYFFKSYWFRVSLLLSALVFAAVLGALVGFGSYYIPILKYYSNPTEFGIGQLILASFLVLACHGSMRIKDSSTVLWIGLILLFGLREIDFGLSRLSWFFLIPLLWYDWSRIFGIIRINREFKAIPVFALFLLLVVNLHLKSADPRNSFFPYKSHLSNFITL